MTHLTNNHKQIDSNNLPTRRFLARSVGILAILTGLIYLRVIGLESISALRLGQWAATPIILLALIAAATLAILCAWRWEMVGGLVAVLTAVAIAILAYNAFPTQRWFAAFAYSSPFLITGALFLACRQRSRHRA